MADPGKSLHTAYSVRALSGLVESWINRLGAVWVTGQLTELNIRRGWVYITLRDTQAEASISVSCTTAVFDSAGPLAEGAEVAMLGKFSWWTKSGRITFNATDIRPVGQGQLLAQLEQRKQLLRAEGLFDSQRKRKLPFLPRSIGLITGKDSAAEADVLSNVHRRWPAATFVVAHAAVQGPRCVPEVIAALRTLDELPEVEVIVIARGGGSFEDLLGFSDESLVRAVSAAHTPVVSAIGHDVDTPLLDLVADWRASTPTDAAKRIVPDAVEERERINAARTRSAAALGNLIAREHQHLTTLRSRPVMHDPSASLAAHRERIDTQREHLRRASLLYIRSEQTAVENSLARIRAMSPKATLERGYAILVDDHGVSVSATTDTAVGASLTAYVTDGQLQLRVDATQPHDRKAAHD